MRLEIAILGITSFFMYNAYHDGKYTKLLLTFQKHYKIIFYAFLGICVYLLLKKNPYQGRNMLMQANNYIKYLPIDKNSQQFINPILDFTASMQPDTDTNMSSKPLFNNFNNKRMLNSGKNATKRSVSETKKKYVASRQDWKCDECSCQLDHTFEVDHRIRLEYGGGNDVHNLVALCRNCHGKKTAEENMK
jgi:hypothetical protein